MAIDRLLSVLHTLNDGRFHSGAELGKTLAITRSAIWKMTKQLERYGINLESIVGRGYRLTDPISFLDTEAIQAALSPQAEHKIKKIEIFDTTTCLQSYLSSRVYESSKIPRACFTEYIQPSHHANHKPSIAQQLNMGLLWQFDTQRQLNSLLAIACIATTQVIKQQLGNIDLKLCPDGSICHNDKTLARLKTTTRCHGQSSQFAVISLCLNTNNRHDTQTLDLDDTSLANIKKRIHNRNALAAKLINQLCYCLTTFQKCGDQLFIDEWQQLCQDAYTA